MRQRKYTLPRHTNLAKQGARTGAFFIDLALGFAITLGFFFGCFNLVFKPITKPCTDLIAKEQIKSHLYYKDSDGNPSRIPSSKTSETFRDSLYKYYSIYLPGKTLSGEKEKQPLRDVKWFNKNILEAESEDSVYTYKKVGEEIKYYEFAVPKDGVVPEEVSKFIQTKYQDAIIDSFNQIDFIRANGARAMTFNALAFTLSSFIGFTLSYVVLPWILKNGQTLGKKVFGIGLATSDGYKFRNHQLLMRFMPFLVCDLSLMLFIQVNMYLVLSIYLIIFLVSFAIAMASPKKMALHDFTARTLVVDLKTSILFDNPAVEENYLLKEDNILEDDKEEKEYEGEEPALKYEK